MCALIAGVTPFLPIVITNIILILIIIIAVALHLASPYDNRDTNQKASRNGNTHVEDHAPA